MKFAAVIEYAKDKDQIKSLFPAHRTYLRTLHDACQLLAAGPLTDDSGAIWVVEAETREKADEMVRSDPYNKEGLFVKWEIHSFQYFAVNPTVKAA